MPLLGENPLSVKNLLHFELSPLATWRTCSVLFTCVRIEAQMLTSCILPVFPTLEGCISVNIGDIATKIGRTSDNELPLKTTYFLLCTIHAVLRISAILTTCQSAQPCDWQFCEGIPLSWYDTILTAANHRTWLIETKTTGRGGKLMSRIGTQNYFFPRLQYLQILSWHMQSQDYGTACTKLTHLMINNLIMDNFFILEIDRKLRN